MGGQTQHSYLIMAFNKGCIGHRLSAGTHFEDERAVGAIGRNQFQSHVRPGPTKIIIAPNKQIVAPMASQRSGRISSTAHSQMSEARM